MKLDWHMKFTRFFGGCSLVAITALIGGIAHASTNNFVVPSFRGSLNSEAGYWESFTVPFGAPGNAPDMPGATTGAILTQTLSPSALITGTGNLYDPAAITGFMLSDSTPLALGTVVLQARTLGSELDYGGVRLNYTDGAGSHSLEPITRFELDRGTILGASVSSLWQWDLRDLNVTDYTLTFAGAGPSLSFDSMTLDAWNQFELVPEPAAWALAGVGLVLFGSCAFRRRA
jgi:hypothetical protein